MELLSGKALQDQIKAQIFILKTETSLSILSLNAQQILEENKPNKKQLKKIASNILLKRTATV